jgi:hypothetical protein
MMCSVERVDRWWFEHWIVSAVAAAALTAAVPLIAHATSGVPLRWWEPVGLFSVLVPVWFVSNVSHRHRRRLLS